MSLGTSTDRNPPALGMLHILDKMDVYINYAAAGQVMVYRNVTQIFNYTGDVTANSVSALAYVDRGASFFNNTNGANAATHLPEIVVATRDTRAMSVVTRRGGSPRYPLAEERAVRVTI